jgi:hypothetical protein
VARHRAEERRASQRDRLGLTLVAVGGSAVALLVWLGPLLPAAAPSGFAVSSTALPAVVAAATAPAPAAAAPTRLRVASIGVDSSLVPLGIDTGGALETPADYGRAGWFRLGTAPGGVGPAVIAGHLDSTRGPAVFFRLPQLTPGAAIAVDRVDGSTARFTVTDVRQYPKDQFPTAQVYGPTPDAQLRLITCGGDFDSAAASYRDNVVVFARAAPPP